MPTDVIVHDTRLAAAAAAVRGTTDSGPDLTVAVRVRGRVQGVGFRPAIWRLARSLGLAGDVRNDTLGVLVRLRGDRNTLTVFLDRLRREQPPLARIDHVEVRRHCGPVPDDFAIADSALGVASTEVTPDAAVCADCAREILDPKARRHRYAFTTCSDCGPRLGIVRAVPFDRAATTMAPFVMCAACRTEFADPADRRFHAEAIACPACGPKLSLIRPGGGRVDGGEAAPDAIAAASCLIAAGEIVALKGLGGYQLACDATNSGVVERLRALKRRERRPFALMARDLDAVGRYCTLDSVQARALAGPEAPIVLLPANGPERLPDTVAPGLGTLGFMLPTTPLHVLVLERIATPVVMTSGNRSGEPQAVTEAEADERLGSVASAVLTHDRAIAMRTDDSVVRVMAGVPRVLRRGRGHAPAPLALPHGLEDAPDLLAFGGELKAAFCLLKNGEAVLSPHQGDLEDAATFDDWCRNLARFSKLFDHQPRGLVADAHPEYLSAKFARDRARSERLPLVEVQHHHAHIASCLVESLYPLNGPPVLGIVLDGLGWGGDGTLWGGEFLLADYRRYRRLGAFRPVAMPGGDRAAREPWRNLYAHLAAIGWDRFDREYAGLDVHALLAGKPRRTLDAMIAGAVNAPRASSCGRLFDAVAAALGVCAERQAYEGEAAARLEAIVDRDALEAEDDVLAYPFVIASRPGSGLMMLEPLAMWESLLHDLRRGTPVAVIAARFHHGLARAIATMAARLSRREGHGFDAVVLSGGAFQNRILFEEVSRRLKALNFTVLCHARVPPGDGGLALGQAAIGAVQLRAGTVHEAPDGEAREQGDLPCAWASPAVS